MEHDPDLARAAEMMGSPGLYPLKSNMRYRLASPAHGETYAETFRGERLGAWFVDAVEGAGLMLSMVLSACL